MSEVWFTSDTHFAHEALMKHYAARGAFATIEELTEHMVGEWNRLIRHGDTVYHFGDFGCYDTELTVRIARRLHGKLHLIPGNHDKKLVQHPKFQHRCSRIYPLMAELSVHGAKIHACHFPLWEWHQLHRGWWHIHGHLHAKPHGIPGKIMDVGADGNNLLPYHFDEVAAYMETRDLRSHH